MKTLEEKIYDMITELRNELKTYDKVFITDDELEEWDDVFYDVPRISDVSKYEYYEEYAIISIKGGVLRTLCISEGSDDEKNFNVDDITIDELLNIR